MNWPVKKLGELTNILSGFAFDSDNFDKGEGIKLIRIRDVMRGFSQTNYIGEYEEKYLIKRGDMLIGMDGEFNVARWRSDDALLNQRVCKISVSNTNLLDERYLFHFLPLQLKIIEDATPFVTVKHLSVKSIQQIKIPLPPIAEQKRIAELLDTADSVMRLRQQAIAKLDELAQSVFVEMFGDLKKNDKKWKVMEFSSLADNEDYKRKPIKSSDRDNRGGSYPYYGASGIIDTIDDYIFEGESLLVGEDGANLLARSSPIAFMAKGKYWVNNHAHILRQNKNANLRFLEFFLLNTDLKPYITGSAQPKLTRGNLDRILVPTPPLDLQNKFETFVQEYEAKKSLMSVASNVGLNLAASLQHQSFAVN